jgi:uncharacterized protein (TIGR02996 family)
MFAISVSRFFEHEYPHETVRYSFATREVTIGSAPACDVVLDGADGRHARIVEKDGKLIAVDLKSTSGTFVKGRRMTSPLVVKLGDQIAIGGYRLVLASIDIEPVANRVETGVATPSDPVEARLIAAVAAGDDSSRDVYADWLEQQNDAQRAEFLRLQDRLAAMSADEPYFALASARLRELAARIDIDWRIRVGQHVVEQCTFDFRCTKRWSELAETGHRGIRHCDSCKQRVYYCVTVEQARVYAKRGECVALDTGAPRWSNDLAPPYDERVCESCNIDVGEGLRDCPRCGRHLEAMVTVGMLA